MKYAIFEDERYSLQRLQMIMEKLYPQSVLIHSGATVSDAIEFFRQKPDVDFVFLDIELADGSSFEIFDEVNVSTPIIFTTAYQEHALRAFKVNTIDYLLKPVAEGDVLVALNKWENRFSPKPQTTEKSQRILTVSGDKYMYVNISDVAFIMSEDNYVYVYLKSGKHRMTTFQNLSEAEQAVAGHDFFQLSRNIIASIESIHSVSKFFRGRLLVRVVSGDETQEVTVSANRREEFLAWLGR